MLYLFYVSCADVNGEFHQGILRKREPTGAYNNEHSARYNIQKTKDFVKRQKPKGQYHGGAETNSQVCFVLRYVS